MTNEASASVAESFEPVSGVQPKTKKAKPAKQERPLAGHFDPEAFDRDLEWLLLSSAAAMSERGTMGTVLSLIALGDPSGGGGLPSSDLYTDLQIGWGKHVVGDVERYRWLMGAWSKLDTKTQAVLACCYVAPRAMHRADQGFGAKPMDACPTVEAINRDGQRGKQQAIEPLRGSGQPYRTGTESQLGRYAALAFQLTADPAGLLSACRDSQRKGNSRIIKKALGAAKELAVQAHKDWTAAKVGRPRKDVERVRNRPVPTV